MNHAAARQHRNGRPGPRARAPRDAQPVVVPGPGDDPAAVPVPILQQVIESSPVATLIVDEDLRVVVHNQAAARTLSVHPADLANSRFPHQVDVIPYELLLVDAEGVRRLHHLVSEPFAGFGRPAWLVTLHPGALGDEVPEERGLATHDRLTGLANRELLLNRLAEAVRRQGSGPAGRPALVAIDLDRFAAINDRYGVAVGDLVLRAVANRLTAVVGPGDYVSRIGGDEFAVLLAPRTTAEHLDAADRIAAFLGQPIEIDGVEHHCTPMVGVAEPVEGDDERRLLEAAQEAATRAVASTARLARRQLEAAEPAAHTRLRDAVAEGQMFLQYQPIFSLPDRSLVGLEALVRWEHPDDGLIAPDEFIAVADESGSIVPLGQWVVAEVCEQLAEWRSTAAGYVIPPISINVTSRQLADRDFRSHARYEVTRRGLDPSAIRLEITEDALVHHDAGVRATIRQLADDGFGLDLDEFGNGLSSVTRLLDHPITGIKLSRSVVARLMDDERSSKLVLAALEIGRALELPVTAIGAETSDQCAVLERWGCDRVQGFAFARPLAPLAASRFFHRDPDSLPARDPRRPILRSGSRPSFDGGPAAFDVPRT